MTEQKRVRAVPRVVVPEGPLSGEPSAPFEHHRLRYRAKSHRELPHVVKFSGGKSSGMLLFALLENRLLDRDRGDVIVFNNTSCEHPGTYRFARDCMEASQRYEIPFFWAEFQTYEDSRKGEWTRLPSYRLVNDRPISEDNPLGFHWKGEVFEELISWSGFVPNQFSRICTKKMKLEVTRMFLRDWLGARDRVPRLGHYGRQSRLDIETLYRKHRRSRGQVPEDIFARKRQYALSRPYVRPEQRYCDFSPVWKPFRNLALDGRVYGGQAFFGKGGVEYIAFVGLRGDEQVRVERVHARNAGPGAAGYEGEHVYMPLADMRVSREDVNAFWERQSWGLSFPDDSDDGTLSNCVFCFLKGAANLRAVRDRMGEGKNFVEPGFGTLRGTPSDIDWWIRVERTYERDLEAERREIRGNPSNKKIGFFGNRTKFSYQLLAHADGAKLDSYSGALLPCDCTE